MGILLDPGHKTPDGEAVAAMNAVRHGLGSVAAVATGEDAEMFELIRDQHQREYAPRTIVETVLLNQFA